MMLPHRTPIAGCRLALLALTAMLAACSATSDDDDVQPDTAAFEDDRLSFDHPAEFEIREQDTGGEQRLLLASPDGGEPAEASILAFWPLATYDSLDRTVGFFGPDTTSSAVSDFEERDIEVAGATEAVEHRFAATDAVPGEVRPMEFVSVYAMAEAGRTFNLVIAVDVESAYELDDLADTVLGSLQLKDFTVSETDGADAGASDDPAATFLDGRVQLEVPESWVVDETRRRATIQPEGEQLPMLTIETMPDDAFEGSVAAGLDELLADAVGDITVETVTVPGAVEAEQFRRQTEAGLWQHAVVARDGDGQVYAVILAADVEGADPPPDQLVEQIFGSFTLAPTGDTT